MTMKKAAVKSREPVRQGTLFPEAPAKVEELVKELEAEMKLRKAAQAKVAEELGTVEGALRAWFLGHAIPGPEFQERIAGWLKRGR